MQTGTINCPPHCSISELREACDYFLLTFNASTIKCQNLRGLLHELSNDGAQDHFEHILKELILPQMVICATRGDRKCHIFVLHDDDQIVWDFGMKISLLKWARNTRRQLFRLHCTGSSDTSRTAMSPSLFCASAASRRSNLESKVIQLNRKRSRKGREERPRLSTTTCSVPSFTCPGRRRMRSHVMSTSSASS